MTDGLILLGFIAVLIALAVVRIRRRIGLPVGTRLFGVTVTAVVIIVLILWATSRR